MDKMETLPITSIEISKGKRVPKMDYLEELAEFCDQNHWQIEIEKTKRDSDWHCFITIRKKYTFKRFDGTGTSDLRAVQQASRRALERLTEVVHEAEMIKE